MFVLHRKRTQIHFFMYVCSVRRLISSVSRVVNIPTKDRRSRPAFLYNLLIFCRSSKFY